MSVSLATVVFDCGNAAELARFWSAVLDRPVDPGASADYAGLGGERPTWMFNKVPEGKVVKNRVHVDLASATWAAEVERLVALGATRLKEYHQDGSHWITLADPEGNEFDLVEGDA
jgi:hypothetical protein